MYALLINKEQNGLPTVISTLNYYYCDYIQSGYKILATGTKKDLDLIYEDMLTAYCD